MMLTPFEKGLVAHLVADWILQNDWMALNKTSLRHPASWVHAAIHASCLGLALGWQAGLVLGFVHLLIDTRVPVHWWMRSLQEMRKGAGGGHYRDLARSDVAHRLHRPLARVGSEISGQPRLPRRLRRPPVRTEWYPRIAW